MTQIEYDYSPPVDQLLALGDLRGVREWQDYRALGIGQEHIPDLIRMATDETLNFAHPESTEVWAPAHAWRALGQFQAVEAIEPLTQLFHELEDDDWARDELPDIFAMIGPRAIPALSAYLEDSAHGLFPRITAMNSLDKIVRKYVEARMPGTNALIRQLEQFDRNDPEYNSFLISTLLNLKASQALPAIAAAFKAGQVDGTIVRWDNVRTEFQLPASYRPGDVLRDVGDRAT